MRQDNSDSVQAIAEIVCNYPDANQETQLRAGLEAGSDGYAIEKAVHAQSTCR